MKDERSQWAVLAGTRFVLASVVLLGHLDLLPGDHPWTRPGTFLNQGSAVYGFLIISGYSIAASLERSVRGFYSRRFIRIWPPYLVSLAMGAIVAANVSHPLKLADQIFLRPLNWPELIASLTMTQTLLAPALSADGQIWTLAVEWWAYMAAPFLRRWSTRAILIVLMVSLALYVAFPAPRNPADSVGGGMFAMLGWWWLSGFLYFRHRGTPLGYLILFTPALIGATERWIGTAALFGLLAVAACQFASVSDRLRIVFDWLGDLSYPLYLVHVPVLWGFYLCGATNTLLIGASSLLAAGIVLHGADLPIRRSLARLTAR